MLSPDVPEGPSHRSWYDDAWDIEIVKSDDTNSDDDTDTTSLATAEDNDPSPEGDDANSFTTDSDVTCQAAVEDVGPKPKRNDGTNSQTSDSGTTIQATVKDDTPNPKPKGNDGTNSQTTDSGATSQATVEDDGRNPEGDNDPNSLTDSDDTRQATVDDDPQGDDDDLATKERLSMQSLGMYAIPGVFRERFFIITTDDKNEYHFWARTMTGANLIVTKLADTPLEITYSTSLKADIRGIWIGALPDEPIYCIAEPVDTPPVHDFSTDEWFEKTVDRIRRTPVFKNGIAQIGTADVCVDKKAYQVSGRTTKALEAVVSQLSGRKVKITHLEEGRNRPNIIAAGISAFLNGPVQCVAVYV